MNTVIYASVSTDEQTKGFSIDHQLDQMIRFCDNNHIDRKSVV